MGKSYRASIVEGNRPVDLINMAWADAQPRATSLAKTLPLRHPRSKNPFAAKLAYPGAPKPHSANLIKSTACVGRSPVEKSRFRYSIDFAELMLGNCT